MVVTQENVAVNDSRRLSPQQIADTLRERIRTGELKAGDRLPTQAELADEFGVERGTVRQALGLLQTDGLLSNVSKGSPPRIADVAPTRDGPQPTMVGLAPRLTEAFSVPHVRIDAACLTAETLMMAISEPVRQIHDGRFRPQSIDVRILLPSRDITLAFPVPVPGQGEDDDDAVHKRWLGQRNAQGQVLRHNLQSLRSSHGIDVRVTFRALPFTPPVKLYLLNESEALIAYYMIARREETVESEVLEMYDTIGARSLLFSFEKQAGRRDAAFVEESQKWFDALWETITTDLKLS
ncbi:winged helix-turn-helix domain-containing protein [Streptomyces sp. NPDC102256]|uniref:winged helix-turn-helix domain-containing protein n=1 Tax=unclassified Streptomyces TaxID=2593676 RepID=UPI002258583A|nr:MULTISPECIES: winged helix-turn-helix domain-containing protein [unclassified Streptomyces]MCX5284181.1 winged helix-turn-helix domain-containing protein [Streptomyces sp. NBC_00198]